MGKGLGTGYKNIAPMDSHIHSLSAKGQKTITWDFKSKKVKTVNVDFTNLKSIENAEKQKARLEKQGYIETITNPVGVDKYNLIYKKVEDTKVKTVPKDKLMVGHEYDGDVYLTREGKLLKYTGNSKEDFNNPEKWESLNAKGGKLRLVKSHCPKCGKSHGKHIVPDVWCEGCTINAKGNNTPSAYGHELGHIEVSRVLKKLGLRAKGKKKKQDFQEWDLNSHLDEAEGSLYAKSDISSKLKHSKVPDRKFDKVQLSKGMKVEMEHTTSKKVAKAITKAHLLENKNYYKKYDGRKNTKEHLMNAKVTNVDHAQSVLMHLYENAPTQSETRSVKYVADYFGLPNKETKSYLDGSKKLSPKMAKSILMMHRGEN
jgi:hypothetical protein